MLSSCLAFLLAGVLPDSGWTEVKRTGRVVVEIHPVAGSPVDAFRASGVDSVSFAAVAATLLDLPGMVGWCPYLAVSRQVSSPGPDHWVVYQRYDLPWPFADRDIVVDVRLRRDPARGRLRAGLSASSDPSCPPVEGVVRIPAMEGEVTLEDLPDGRAAGTYAERIDLGGSVPSSIARLFSREMPATVLTRLLDECRKPSRLEAGARSEFSRWLDSSRSLRRKGSP